MKHWVFVIKDSERVFKERVKNKVWPIYANTRHRGNIGKNHKILFYKAGKTDGQRFLGTATLLSHSKIVPGKMDSFVQLAEISVWKKPVQIKPILGILEFIKDKQNWGLYLQGGIRRILKSDFELVVSISKK